MKYEDAMKIRLWSGDYTRDRQLSIFRALEDIFFCFFTSRVLDRICRYFFCPSPAENGQYLCKISYSVQICDIQAEYTPYTYLHGHMPL